jgi:hypothetical protein
MPAKRKRPEKDLTRRQRRCCLSSKPEPKFQELPFELLEHIFKFVRFLLQSSVHNTDLRAGSS